MLSESLLANKCDSKPVDDTSRLVWFVRKGEISDL